MQNASVEPMSFAVPNLTVEVGAQIEEMTAYNLDPLEVHTAVERNRVYAVLCSYTGLGGEQSRIEVNQH